MAMFEDYLHQCFNSVSASDVKTFQKKCADNDRKAAIDQALRDTLVLLSENASKCPPFKRPTPDSSADIKELLRKPKRPRHRIGDVIRDTQTVGKYHMGNSKFTKLWNLCPNNLEASKERDFHL
ncbi:hypothetical protein K0M31_001200 [Melipona bicolor]|uniref:Uncharacterized protein n=1 Tax=Melipona bicolor TaxID=60889 RepID=A0AA40KXH5_9HYME|nr:hypothetical protein K0M31_001200 [Melipona bicolor]